MSETTKRAIPTDLMDTGTRWAERVDATHLIAKPVPYHAARANLRAAEGGAKRETTNLPAEIGTVCTGRKNAIARWFLWVTHFAGALFLLLDLGLVFGLLAYATCASFGFLIGKLWILGCPRASRGEGV